MGHGSAAAVAHMHWPTFSCKLLAGGFVMGEAGIFASDNQALGRLPEVSAGLAVMGTVAQPVLLLRQYLCG